MNFQDVISIGNLLTTTAWMAIAYALFQLQSQTFKVQIETFKEQQKISILENKKFLLSIRPEFSIKYNVVIPDPVNIRPDQIFTHSTVTIRLTLNDNGALNVFVRNHSNFLDNSNKDFHALFVKLNEEVKIIGGQIEKRYTNVFMNFEIYFSDEIGTEYYQKLTGVYAKPQLSPPFPVNAT